MRAIVLFNPEAKGLKNVEKIEQLRESVYSTLEKYCRQSYPDQSGRFAKLLLRLPALRSVGLKCVDYLFINKGWSEPQMDNYLKSKLEKQSYYSTGSLPSRIASINGSSLIGINSSMNSINDSHHHIANQALLGLNLNDMSAVNNNLMHAIDSNNNLTSSNGNSNSSGFSDLSTMNSNCINFMSSTPATMGGLIMSSGQVNSSNGALYLPDLSSNNVSNASANAMNSPLSLT